MSNAPRRDDGPSEYANPNTAPTRHGAALDKYESGVRSRGAHSSAARVWRSSAESSRSARVPKGHEPARALRFDDDSQIGDGPGQEVEDWHASTIVKSRCRPRKSRSLLHDSMRTINAVTLREPFDERLYCGGGKPLQPRDQIDSNAVRAHIHEPSKARPRHDRRGGAQRRSPCGSPTGLSLPPRSIRRAAPAYARRRACSDGGRTYATGSLSTDCVGKLVENRSATTPTY